MGGFLAREYGQADLDTPRIYAAGLVQQGYISQMVQFSACSDPLFALGHRPDLGPGLVDLWIGITAFILELSHVPHSPEFQVAALSPLVVFR